MKVYNYVIILIVIITTVWALKKSIKNDNRINKLYRTNNKFVDKNKVTKYKKLITNNPTLKLFRFYFIIINALIVLVWVAHDIPTIKQKLGSYDSLWLLIVFGLIFISTKIKKIYEKNYKKNLVNEAIKDYNPNLMYSPEKGMSEIDYKNGNFMENYDVYKSEDLISGNFGNVEMIMSDVHTEKIYTTNGRRQHSTVFKGTYAKITGNKNINCDINIIDKKLILGNKANRIIIDNSQFEKEYDVTTNDKIMCLRILTPNLTTKIIDFKNTYGIHFEIKISDNIIYFRFYTGDLFKPYIYSINKEAVNVCKYINILKIIEEITLEISNVIEELEV